MQVFVLLAMIAQFNLLISAMFIPFRKMDSVFSCPFDCVVGMFSMSVGDFDDLFAEFLRLPSPFTEVAQVCTSPTCIPLDHTYALMEIK